MAKVIIDPVTRIEGHLRVDTEVSNQRIVNAWSKGEMFRGFETLLKGRDPFDAPVITQRICGVCPVSHAVASCKTVEDSLGIDIPENARLMRNLILGSNYLASHLTHFYQLSALDFIQVEAILKYRGSNRSLRNLRAWVEQEIASKKILPAAPFLPYLKGDYPKDQAWNFRALAHYLESLDVRKDAHKMAALLGGKMPHTSSMLAGGVTTGLAPDLIENFRVRLLRIRQFVDETYLPDVVQAATLFKQYSGIGAGNAVYLSYGVFDEEDGTFLPSGLLKGSQLHPLEPEKIAEQTLYSYYRDGAPRHPSQGETLPDTEKDNAYSWIKAPRYAGMPCEVGPLARLMIAYKSGINPVRQKVTALLAQLGWQERQLNSVLGRHATRALEASMIAERMELWLDQLDPGQPTVGEIPLTASGQGAGLTEAPRGALGHWLTIEQNKIDNYQCIVPSTWNFSPAGQEGEPGPVETALIGTPVAAGSQGIEAARVVRSFDPCIACAIH